MQYIIYCLKKVSFYDPDHSKIMVFFYIKNFELKKYQVKKMYYQ